VDHFSLEQPPLGAIIDTEAHEPIHLHNEHEGHPTLFGDELLGGIALRDTVELN